MAHIDRDLHVVRLVAQFEAMTSSHLRRTVFAGCASSTPCKRTLTRLVDQKYLARYHWRFTTGQTGSAQYVYQLGREGWKYIGYEGTYKPLETFDRHKLAITDLYVMIKTMERDGLLTVLNVDTEPNNWRRIGHIELRPDLFLRLQINGRISRWWMEVDRNTEHKAKLMEKIRRYVRAHDSADGSSEEWRVFPLVLFVVPTDSRREEIEGYIHDCHADELVKVCTVEGLEKHLLI